MDGTGTLFRAALARLVSVLRVDQHGVPSWAPTRAPTPILVLTGHHTPRRTLSPATLPSSTQRFMQLYPPSASLQEWPERRTLRFLTFVAESLWHLQILRQGGGSKGVFDETRLD